MSLLPTLLSDYWDEFERPRSLLDRYWGVSSRPEDIFESLEAPGHSDIIVYRPLRGRIARRFQPYDRITEGRSNSKGASIVKADKDKFHVTLDTQQFRPEEISVKVVDNYVVVEGKHEEKEDEHGWISRQFSRKYLVPSQCDVDQVQSKLSSDGTLTITAPRKPVPASENRERVVKIQHTGKPALQDNETPEQMDLGKSMANGQVQEKSKESPRSNAEKKKKNIVAA